MSKEMRLRAFMEEVWNKQNKEAVADYVCKAYQIYLDTGDNWEGQTLDHQAFKERLDFSFNSFPDMNFEINSAIEEENHVAITWVLTGTNLGKIGEFPPTNKKIKVNGMTIYFFKDNLISGHSQVFDRRTVMRQLGFV